MSIGNLGLQIEEPLLFEQGAPDKTGVDLPAPPPVADRLGGLARRAPIGLPGLSEPEVVRHFTRLSQKNYGIDVGVYPLGSCTMKHNPRLNERLARLPGFADIHPMQPVSTVQGALELIRTLTDWIVKLTGMPAVAMSMGAGAHGELCGLMAIRAALAARGDARRTVLVPDSAHGTNPATAHMCGYAVEPIPHNKRGRVDLAALKARLGPDVAAFMLTNPSTCGLFEDEILEQAAALHAAGAFFYCDGANFNALVGRVRPGDLGIDCMHLNLHKTFSTPHGGGGPGAGPVGAAARLLPYLPLPLVVGDGGGYRLADETDLPQSIGRLSAHGGNAGVLLRAYVYARLLGREGMQRVAEFATLNANYLMARLRQAGFEIAFPARRASHEFVVTLKALKETTGVTAMDLAKRLLDKGFHAPTTYFPQLVPECLLIEPTETESKQTLDAFVQAMQEILEEAQREPQLVKSAPHTTPVRRLDEVKAARELDLAWKPRAH